MQVRITGISGGGATTVDLVISFVKNYPAEPPPLSVICTAGRIANLDALTQRLLTEATGCVGMAMVFSLVTAAEDWLRDNVKPPGAATLLTSSTRGTTGTGSGRAASAEGSHDSGTVTLRGGPVTRDSFAAWNAKFMAEVKETRALQAKRQAEQAPVKLTGRELFERNKALANSDALAEGEEEGDVVLDASVFEGLDSIEVEGDFECSDPDVECSALDAY